MAGNNTGASHLTTGASRPDKELAYGEQNIRTTGASRLDKELAYGEQNFRPLAEWKPAYGGQ